VRNILPPSPFRSVRTFLVYCLTLSTPVWALLSFAGVVDLIRDHADLIGGVLAHPVGMWIPVVVGFILLIRINYRERAEPHASPEATAESEAEENPSLAASPTEPEEVERLKTRLREVEQERDARDATIKGQQEQLNHFDGDRAMFRSLLVSALEKGHKLRESDPNEAEARRWGERVSDLLEAAVGDWLAKSVMEDDPHFRSAIFGSTSEQKWMESRLNRLHDKIRWVESSKTVPFRSEFDPHDYDLDTFTLTSTDGKLKRRCLKVADELFQFLENHGIDDSSDPDEPEVQRKEKEAMKLYRRRLRGKVRVLLQDLEQHGWYPPESLPGYKQRPIENPLSLYSVERIADVLVEIGHRS